VTITEADLTQRVDADHVRRRRFAYARRGFDVDQVQEYLGRVADRLERLEREAHNARAEAEGLARGTRSAREDAYTELAERIADVLRTADRHAETTKSQAEEQAERLLSEARAEAEGLRLEAEGRAAQARREAEEIIRQARAEAERLLAGLAARRDGILADLQRMRERLVGVVERIETTMDPAIDPTDDATAVLGADLAAEVAEADPVQPRGLLDPAGWDDPPSSDSLDLDLPLISLDEDVEDEGDDALGTGEDDTADQS
jgi:DivIVA domain-containing protein